ncbi:hypothetical protein P1J78_13435 [Psychromarinibacter sp. C21-152]|uniref:Uncharacterized protein n=1 Tax=Psychromarinibacter sediminicola TaxID=3033385 RepID=A0AAE3NW55_9RHOB|nr:hypothetical protein [Psychromarinibacter sediminicola]MDF0601742.1 hypothetical protein [Psychromarinibacter sediminicola]
MTGTALKLGLFALIQIAVVTWLWYILVPDYRWVIVQQFYGHLGPGAFLVAMGAAALFFAAEFRRLNRIEAWLAIVAGAAYVLADTFIMHPPLGVFDGAGPGEQEHVSIMGLILVLGISGLVVLRRHPEGFPTGAHFLIPIAIVAMVFLNHHQHTQAGTIGHQATLIVLGAAALFRVLGKVVEYGIAMIVTGYVFFSSQMGLAMYVDMNHTSGGAWVAAWATLGFVAATVFIALSPGTTKPAE